MADPLTGMYEWEPSSLDGPAEVAKAMRETRRQIILRFASAAARDAAFTAAKVNPDGCVCRLASRPSTLYMHINGQWQTYGQGAFHYTANTLGGFLNLGAQGVTSRIDVVAGDSKRVVQVSSGFHITSQTVPTSQVDLDLHVNGQPVKSARGTGNFFSLSIGHSFELPARSGVTLQLVMSRPTNGGGGDSVATSDPRLTWLSAIVHAAA